MGNANGTKEATVTAGPRVGCAPVPTAITCAARGAAAAAAAAAATAAGLLTADVREVAVVAAAKAS